MFSLSLSRLASPMRLLCVVLTLSLLSGCGGALGLLTGGGPNVAANGQIGQENNQGIVQVNTDAPRVTVRPKARVDTIDQSTTTNVSIPPWVLLIIVALAAGGAIGWVDNILRLFRRKK